MQSVLRFTPESDYPAAKRRKTARACQRCQQSKKRCAPPPEKDAACERCLQDGRQCSFESQLPSPASLGTGAAGLAADEQPVPWHGEHSGSIVPKILTAAKTRLERAPAKRVNAELRYSTMLDMLQDPSAGSSEGEAKFTKLVGGTNPLSALLQKDLKHKIITNLCAFRTPDPVSQRSSIKRLPNAEGWDWESHYATLDIRPAKLDYLRALGCFKMPKPMQSGQLLDVFFTHIHPLLPVIDRSEFLARFFGQGGPPPLVQMLAVFLAAARYCPGAFDHAVMSGCDSVRDVCDVLFQRLRALIDVDIVSERLAVLQAAVLGSLHWEGREGVNSSLDALSIAVRLAQEMGLHRRSPESGSASTRLQRRIWWSIFALDRLNAATEGTSFIINELDCDAAPLGAADFVDEDPNIRDATLLNLDLASVVNDAVRWLYSPEVTGHQLHSRAGEIQRDHLTRRLDKLDERAMMLEFSSKIYRIHINAVRMLVHRPFLLHQETNLSASGLSLPLYKSRESCRIWASESIGLLQSLPPASSALTQVTWPFTVYAIVNSLLIVWYDFTAPQDATWAVQARESMKSIIELLKGMGGTWWAAAAKYKLAEALLRIGDRLHEKKKANTAPDAQSDDHARDNETTQKRPFSPITEDTSNEMQQFFSNMDHPSDVYAENDDFWATLGLDFESEVAQGIYGVL
ncbi:Transcriptional activator of fatty acid utilization [Elasticomyces elasticus]|nr:Transcriptional activator of fatty acid utilization [Elasticomyces elasticus]KAK3628973.1 Transcriptional activator of fatty acid utilization [Elasticomyces elasticus]KAK4909220.1 Transcriptional activator of fatty acid utilization [Elasticomyces elasticus]KAK5743890.1 Transcriptional activator of fatty acid utilization [Elasticomyces elasticus]